jgi:hypothetical protein
MLTLRAMAALAQPFEFCAAVSYANASHAIRQRKATLCCSFRFFARNYLVEKIVGQKNLPASPRHSHSQRVSASQQQQRKRMHVHILKEKSSAKKRKGTSLRLIFIFLNSSAFPVNYVFAAPVS